MKKAISKFNIVPGVGALPIRFGMARSEVHTLLGPPERSGKAAGATRDYWFRMSVNIGYNKDGFVNHIGFAPGKFELSFRDAKLWTTSKQPDPNVLFLSLDPAPMDCLGFLVFDQLCLTTTGYHDNDDSQHAITVYPPGTWKVMLRKGTKPDLSRY
jgi:hypothetical protein